MEAFVYIYSITTQQLASRKNTQVGTATNVLADAWVFLASSSQMQAAISYDSQPQQDS